MLKLTNASHNMPLYIDRAAICAVTTNGATTAMYIPGSVFFVAESADEVLALLDAPEPAPAPAATEAAPAPAATEAAPAPATA